jgi:hypothetical protein
MSLLMRYLDVILCYLNLIIKILVGSRQKNYKLLILTSRMLMRIVYKGEHEINMCSMTVFCTVLTNFVFSLISSVFCFYRKHMDVV